jgi:hypothetical protein
MNTTVFLLESFRRLFSDWNVVLPLPSPGPPLGADLSTIIEAENSGISKHIPYLGDATHGDGDDDTPTSPFNLEQIGKSRLPSPDSRAASIFDLSTSRLAAEVMDALKVEDATSGSEWLTGVNGVVVEEGADDPDPFSRTPVNAARGDEDLDAALDFDALDPDLAELLSPNRINDKSQSPNPVFSRLPRAHSRSPSNPVSTSSLRPPNGDGVSPRTSPRLGIVVPQSASCAIVQSSPARRSASLSCANLARGPPSSLPRLMRSVTAAPPSASDSSDGSSTPPGLRGPPKKRHQPPSPLSSQAQSSQAPSPASSRGSTDMPPRRLAGSRFATPNRHVSSYVPGNSRLTDTSPTLLPSTSEKASSSQFLPRSTSDPTRQPNSRPSLETNGALDVNKRRRPHLFLSRRRSMSVEEARLSPTSGSASPIRPSSSLSNQPPVMEWLGPRTVKAFAAAGLLDGDRDGFNTHPSGPSKYASLRAHSEREDRFVPSRMAFSEAASTSSWGRSGSVSRGMTPSEGGITWGSPTFSAPRTTFSGSTAPTSISAASSSQQAAVQVMKEKHDLETEALLSALSDSQRTTKTLREENLQLRDRIRELEDELDEMRSQIHRFASGVLPPRAPPPGALSRSPHNRPVLLPSPLVPPHRPTMHRSFSHAHTNGLSVSTADRSPRSSRAASPSRGDLPAPVAVLAPRPRRRRASTSSSVFPSLPQNMSLLMLEETVHDRPGPLSVPPSPPSPACGIPQRSSLCNMSVSDGPVSGPGHIAHSHAHHSSSLSSGNMNISPTIASFSMTEIPGSPSSLQLRPEHELHLGDMASLSIYAMSDEEL